MLCSEVRLEEVSNAVKSMQPYKAPGINGLQPIFFQSQWHTVFTSLLKLCRDVINGVRVITTFETLLVLIPKVTSPERLSQFRPISLCNVSYKVISKICKSFEEVSFGLDFSVSV